MKHQLVFVAVFALGLAGCNRTGGSAIALTSGSVPPVLLFNGTGTSPNDVAAIESLLEKSRIAYSTASSAQLDDMMKRVSGVGCRKSEKSAAPTPDSRPPVNG